MQPRQVEARGVRFNKLRLDFIERQRRRINNAGIAGTLREQFARHDRAGVEADRTTRDQVSPAYRDKVRRTGPRSDEMHRHRAASVSASAQVAGPTAMRGTMSRAAGPPAPRAAVSATDGAPVSAVTRSDRVTARPPAITRSPCGIRTSGTPIADAAAAMPGSLPLALDVARRPSCEVATPSRANAAAIAASISAARAPLRHPMPATIMV